MSATTTQDHLDRFYIELQAWIDGGCGKHPSFSAKYGLCANLAYRAYVARLPYRDMFALRDALADSFEAAKLCPSYPFYVSDGRADYDAITDYLDEQEARTIYRNPARLAWIKARADEAKARQAVAA